MRDRRRWMWMAGLGLVAAASVGLAFALSWWGADLQAQADAFYSSQSGTNVSQDVYDYWNGISSNGYAMQTLAAPLLLGAFVAVFALLAVLARRWDLAHRPASESPRDALVQDEATAAS